MSPVRARLPHPVKPTPDDRPPGTPHRPHTTSARAEAAEAARAAAMFLVWDEVDEWGAQSFPASDPPANW
jgi:hypothetical protein